MKIGYARVSTEEQNLDLQIEALTEAGCDRIVTDQAKSGATAAETRSGFSEAMELLDEGDLLVVWKLDRVGRSIADLVHLLKLFGDRGIEFRSLTDGIDTTTAGGRLVFHIMGALAEFERDLIQERTKAGLRAAKKRGKQLGRPPVLSAAQIAHARTAIATKRETVSGMAEILGVNRSTLQRAMSRDERVGARPPSCGVKDVMLKYDPTDIRMVHISADEEIFHEARSEHFPRNPLSLDDWHEQRKRREERLQAAMNVPNPVAAHDYRKQILSEANRRKKAVSHFEALPQSQGCDIRDLSGPRGFSVPRKLS
ncbi:recombinase family protein [Leisingera sp. M658]|uniref:recombinase family protein n=1 Tax=Leisingera sp. M658 TaxID=2867015 RepID=UPI00288313C1|nr:recombinase family protein [Leisingera sp. M658]